MMHGQKGSVLILTLLLMITSVGITLAYVTMIRYDIILVGNQANSVHALYTAEAGLNKAVWYLLNTAPDATTGGTWRTSGYPSESGAGPNDPQEESFEGGAYTIWVEDSGADILITARGTYRGVSRIVHQQQHVDYTPEAFRYPVFSGGDIDFDNSTAFVGADTVSKGMTITSPSLTVSGTINEFSAINVPMVDVYAYESTADTVISGDHTFNSGSYDGVWFIDGNVTIASGVTVVGSVIASGNIDFAGQTDITVTSTTSAPALFAASNILADNTMAVNIAGLVYAGNEAQMSYATDFSLSGVMIAGAWIVAQNGINLTFSYDVQVFESPPPFFSDNAGSITLTTVAGSWGLNSI